MGILETIISIIVSSAISVSIALLTFRHDSKELKPQSRVQLFAEYTRRHQDIALRMPTEALNAARVFGEALAVPYAAAHVSGEASFVPYDAACTPEYNRPSVTLLRTRL